MTRDVPSAGRPIWVLGFMSGTSAEGVDAAFVRTDGEVVAEFGPTFYEPLTNNERTAIRDAMSEAASRRAVVASDLSDRADDAITAAHLRLIANLPVDAPTPQLVGFHGQTLLHRPPPTAEPVTWQVGDAHAVARALDVPVVMDLRAADIVAGGQGAPLVPVFHQALIERIGLPESVAVLNIGGVANLTLVDGPTLVACDCGPGNAPLDEWAEKVLGRRYDEDGRHAAAGSVRWDVIETFLAEPFFAEPPPKSLDRYDLMPDTSAIARPNDVAATITASIAHGIAAARHVLPKAPGQWIVCGGGSRNPVLMAMLRKVLAVPVTAMEAHGLDSAFVEAQAFAYLAARSVRGLPITFPETTGAPWPMTGGRLVRPDGAVA